MVVGEWFRAWLVAHNVGIAIASSYVIVVAHTEGSQVPLDKSGCGEHSKVSSQCRGLECGERESRRKIK